MIIKVPGTVFYSLFWHYDYSFKNFFYSLGEKEKSFLLKGSSIFKHMVVAAAAKSHQSCPTLCNPIDGSPPGSRPRDSPGKNTGVGCHFLLQCMKVESERDVAQSCPTLRDPMDCSLPGSSIHGIFQGRVLECGCHCLLRNIV